MPDILLDRRLKRMKKRHNGTGNTAEVVVRNTEAGSSGSLLRQHGQPCLDVYVGDFQNITCPII